MSSFVKLSEIAELTVGFVGTMAEYYTDKGVPFLRSLNVKPYYIDDTDIKYISFDFYSKISKSILHTDDIIIVRTGIPGTSCVVPEKYNGCNCSDVVIVRPNKEKVEPHFLATYINIWGQKQIHNNRVGAVQKHFNVHSAEELLISLPDIHTQRRITNLIKSINGLIQNNNRINDNLQQQLKLIYDYWFTQFDFPDENGKPYRSSGGAMVWNEQLKRKIPFNWRIMGIKEITDITWGQCPEGKNILDRTAQGDNVLDYCSGAGDMKGGFLVDCQAKTDNSKRIAHKNDILVSIAGKIGDMCVVDHTISLGRATMAYTVKDKKEITFVYLTLQALNRKMTTISTGSIQKVINSDHINDFLFPYQKDIVIQFGELTEDIFSELIKLSHENRQLVNLRDWLLPMLMNGQATISD